MMFLFLVRHAKSETLRDCWQTPGSKLGKIGKQQAEILSKRSRFLKLDKIFSSDWERSQQTAKIISTKLGVDTEVLDYIHEREQLHQMYGSARDSKISKEYVAEYYENYGNLDWKFKGKEESLRQVLERSAQLSEFLIKNYQGKRVLIISHDVFIRCFVGLILLGKDYSDKPMVRTISSLTINPAGISLLIYSNQRKMWKINYINDYAHSHVV